MFNSILFPHFCVNCNRLGALLCSKCGQLLQPVTLQSCIICQRLSVNGITHKYCSGGPTPFAHLSAFTYAGVAKKIITKSKFGTRSYGLVSLLTRHPNTLEMLNHISEQTDLINPLPSKSSLVQKAHTTAAVIASEIADIIHKPQIQLLRALPKTPQKNLARNRRLINVKGKYELSQAQIPTDANILLVDDVTTTGATLLECTKVLMQVTTGRIYTFALATDTLQ